MLRHCSYVCQQIAGTNHGQYAMVVLSGTGNNPLPKVDMNLLRNSLGDLDILN